MQCVIIRPLLNDMRGVNVVGPLLILAAILAVDFFLPLTVAVAHEDVRGGVKGLRRRRRNVRRFVQSQSVSAVVHANRVRDDESRLVAVRGRRITAFDFVARERSWKNVGGARVRVALTVDSDMRFLRSVVGGGRGRRPHLT